MSKFKVGDKVRIVTKKTGCFWNSEGKMDKWLGKVMTVARVDGGRCRMEEDSSWWNWYPHMIAGLAIPRYEIHITCTDGKTTHAVKKVDGKITAKEQADCAPDDEFNFDAGAELAFNRLVWGMDYTPKEVAFTSKEKQEPVKLYCVKDVENGFTKGKVYEVKDGMIRFDDGTYGSWPANFENAKREYPSLCSHLVPLVKRPAKVGEWVYVKDKIGGYSYSAGDIAKVEKTTVFDGDVRILGGQYICAREYLVLDGYKPEPEKAEPEYLNMRVVCVAGSSGFTVGKVYEFKNGVVVDDDGDVRPSNGDQKITSLSDTYLRDWENKFIEFKGE